MMKRFALTWLLVLIFALKLCAQNTGVQTYNVRNYGAKGDGTSDDTAAIARAIAAAVAYEAAYDATSDVVFPRGTYVVQDPTDVDGAAVGTSAGCIRIPAGASKIRLIGQGAKILLGANGTDTSVVRVFGAKCEVRDLEIDLNGTVPVATKPNIGIQINAAGGGTDNVDGCDNVVTGCYVHNSRRLTTYSTGTITYDHTGNGSGERALILAGGTWPAESEIIDGADATNLAAVLIAGTWYDVSSRVSNTVLLLSTSDNPGSDVAAGTAYVLNAEPYADANEDGIQNLNGHRNRIERNLVVDVGWSAIRTNGNGNIVSRNTLIDFRGNGIRIADGDYCLIEGNWISSTHCSGRSNLLADAGSGEDGDSDTDPTDPEALTNNDVRTKDLVIRDNYSYCNSNGNFEGAGSAIKLGSIRNCVVDGGVYYAGTDTNNTAIRIEDGIRKVTFKNLRCVGPFQQTNNAMTTAVTATVSRASGDYAGKLQLTISGHGQILGKSVWLVNCPVANWDDQEFIVLEVVDANNIVVGRITDDDGTVTPEPYAADSITGTVAHASVHELVVKNVMVERGTHDENNFMRFISSPWVSIEDCIFEQVGPRTDGTVLESGLLFGYPSDAYIKRLRIARNEFRFDTSALCRVIRSDNDSTASSAATTFITAGKFVCYGNRLENRSTGTVELVNRFESPGIVTASYDDRLIIFSTEGENPNRFVSAAAPTEAFVVWSQGDTIRNPSPSAGGQTTTWAALSAGTGATWRTTGMVANGMLVSSIADAGNNGGGEDDLISYSMPANTLAAAGESLEIEAGYSLAANGNTKTIKLYVGSADVLAIGGAAQNGGSYVAKVTVTRDTSSTGKLGVTGGTYSLSGTPLENIPGRVYPIHSLDFTGILTIKGTGQSGSSASNDVVMEYLRVRKVPAP